MLVAGQTVFGVSGCILVYDQGFTQELCIMICLQYLGLIIDGSHVIHVTV